VSEVKAAKDDGSNATQARAVAEAIAREAFHNVAYFEGEYATLAAALTGE
jgi:hypothetical protein